MADQRGNIAQFNAGDGPALNLSEPSQVAGSLARQGWKIGDLDKQAGASYRQAGDVLGRTVDEHEYMDEVSKGAPTIAALHNNALSDWNKMASQPGAGDNKTLQQDFLDKNLEPQLQQFQNGFSTERGQMWALNQADETRKTFFEKTSADVMNMKAEARMQDLVTARNQWGAVIQKDPTHADAAIASFTSSMEAMKASMATSPEEAAKFDKTIKEQTDELAKEQVKALFDQNNPKAALAALDAHTNNIAPEWQSELRKYGQTAARQNQEDVMRGMEIQRMQKAKQDDAIKVQMLDKAESGISLSNKEIRDSNLSYDGKSEMYARKKAEDSQGNVDQDVSTKTKNDIMERMNLPASDPKAITSISAVNKAVIQHHMTPADAKEIEPLFKDSLTDDQKSVRLQSMKTLSKAIMPYQGMNDLDGETLYGKAMTAMFQAEKDDKTGHFDAGDWIKKNAGTPGGLYYNNKLTAVTDALKPGAVQTTTMLPPTEKRIVGETKGPGGTVWATDGKGKYGWKRPDAQAPSVPRPE
jgi:hypothetical protein